MYYAVHILPLQKINYEFLPVSWGECGGIGHFKGCCFQIFIKKPLWKLKREDIYRIRKKQQFLKIRSSTHRVCISPSLSVHRRSDELAYFSAGSQNHSYSNCTSNNTETCVGRTEDEKHPALKGNLSN